VLPAVCLLTNKFIIPEVSHKKPSRPIAICIMQSDMFGNDLE
jgi:hypothetical protein